MKAGLAMEIQHGVLQISILCWGFWIICLLAIVMYLTLTNFLRTLRVLVTTQRVLDHWRVWDNGRRLLVTTLRVLEYLLSIQ